jgi:hypothetical protein
MTLTVSFERITPIGSVRKLYLKIVDAGPSGGAVDLSSWLSHILWANAVDITNGGKVTTIWTDGNETITLGNAGSNGATVKLVVEGF